MKVTGLAVDGVEVWDDTQFADGVPHRPDTGDRVTSNSAGPTGAPRSACRSSRARRRPRRSRSSCRPNATKDVRLTSGGRSVDVDGDGASPPWHSVAGGGPTLRRDQQRRVPPRARGLRRRPGFLEPDAGQYAWPEEVFAWCGGAALLSVRYLREVGIFDDRYFMYYEDTDLVVARPAGGVALPLRARLRGSPRARGEQQGGLAAVRALRRAQPLPHAGPQRPVVDVRRCVLRVPARHRS